VRHPEHDRLVEEVRSWYLTSHPKSGYYGEQRRFGYYVRNADNPDFGRIVIHEMANGDVSGFLADARAWFGRRVIEIMVNDAGADLKIGPALVAAGCSAGHAVTYLAYLPNSRPLADRRSVSDLTIDSATAETLQDFVVAKLKGFAGSEDEPSPEQVASELAVRQGELQGEGRFLLGRLGGETVGIVGYWGGADRLVFQLATRAAFRECGIARQLLYKVLADAAADGCSSVIINTNPEDTPIQWYRRLGFCDEVYWYRSYSYAP